VTDSNNVVDRRGGGPTPGTPSSSLLAGLRASDAGAWRRLAVLYTPLVYRWCRRRGLQQSDAEDVVQEVFCTVLTRVHDFRRRQPGDSFRGWLWTITYNKLGDHFRRSAGRAAGGQEELEQAAAPPDSDSGESDAATAGLYRRAYDLIRGEFEERTWQAFWRVAVEDQRPADVAAALGLSVNSVYLAKSRVLRRLHEELGDVAGE
jgi:RNA polymerase sigma-70 factor, ECF subfamily